MKRYLLILMAALCVAAVSARTRKAVYVIVDGVPADQIERLHTPAIFGIAEQGGYARAYTGGEVGNYTETPTISAVGYTNLLTGTWVNKHNVKGNNNQNPNYNYWTLFRIAAEQPRKRTTGLFSGWTDNRTVLIGEGRKETGNLKIDHVFDGCDKDTVKFPHKELEMHVFDYDEAVTDAAAKCIREDAPDLSWVYLWYPDDAGHLKGNGEFFDEYVRKADDQVARIWDAVKYREENFDEDWMIIVTTDHGRRDDGFGHGRQSERERGTWISVNKPVNSHFTDGTLSIVDIAPTIIRYLGLYVPRDNAWEQDGVPFFGQSDIYGLKARPYDDGFLLEWNTHDKTVPVNVYVATSNDFADGGKDKYVKVAQLPAGRTSCKVAADKVPASKFYKFVVTTPATHLNSWVRKK